MELLIALSLFSAFSLFLLQVFIVGMGHTGRANERAAATTVGIQIMEQVRASVNPYTMVGFTDLPRTLLPLPAPYSGVVNPTPHRFEAAVDVTPDNNLTLTTVTVQVYKPGDPNPLVTMTTVLDDQ